MNYVLPAIDCLACPLDGLPLALTENGNLICPHNHTFDRAKQGYFNLLPVQYKPSKEPGDSRDMVAARKRVLDSGAFESVCDALIDCVRNCTQYSAHASATQTHDTAHSLVMDAGCGDGYYTLRLAQALSSASPDIQILGMDISKWAVIAAAKRSKQIVWAVANNKRPPIRAGAAQVITSLFGFETWQPWSERQTAGQWVVTVAAADNHLLELRELVYEIVEQHGAPDDTHATMAGYEKMEAIPVTYQLNKPSSETLTDILLMTPHGKRATRIAGSSKRFPPLPLLTIDALIRVYKKR